MAAPICRVPLVTTFRLVERLLPSGASVSRPHMTGSCWQQQISPRGSVCTASNVSNCKPVCTVAASPLVMSHRHSSWYADRRVSLNLGAVGIPKPDPDVTVLEDKAERQELAQMVNTSVEQKEQGRLFAVVHIGGQQRKITVEDVLLIENEFHPTVGDRLCLEKVLMVGGKDFTLIGQPILSREQVRIEATVIEKTLSHNQVWSTYKRRKRFRKLLVQRTPHSMLVINSIELGAVPPQ